MSRRTVRFLPPALAVCGPLLIVWALIDGRFRDLEGLLDGAAAMPIGVGLAALLLARIVPWSGARSSGWLALALVGQAAMLQLIQAGPFMRYQHFRPLEMAGSPRETLMAAILAAQLLAVATGLARRLPQIRAWIRRNLGGWRWIAIGFSVLLSSAAVSPRPLLFGIELLFATSLQLVQLGNVVLFAVSLPAEAVARLGGRLSGWLDDETAAPEDPPRLERFVWVAALWVTAASAAFCWFAYERHPHIPDEVAYLVHADYFADGRLDAPAPAVPEAFEVYLMRFDGDRWYPSPPPGWPLVLAIGAALGAAWLVNPVLAGLCVAMTYLFLADLYPRRTARLATLLLAFSPWHLFMGMNFMTHMLTLTCALAAALAIIRSRRSGRAGWAWLAGAAIGLGSLVRPLDGLLTAGLLGLWAIGAGGRRLRWVAVAALVLGTMLVSMLVLPYNAELTGDPLRFPIMAYADEHFRPNANALGFGPDRGMGWPIDPYPGHSPRDALINGSLNIFQINVELLGWGTGAVVWLALVLFGAGPRRSDWSMLFALAATYTTFFFYYFSGGPDFGARYWFLAIVPCVALTARAIEWLRAVTATRANGDDPRGLRVLATVFALILASFTLYLPWRAIDKYHHYLNMRAELPALARSNGIRGALVLVAGDEHPDYASAMPYNPPVVAEGDVIYAWDRGDEVRGELARAYPDREFWLVDGPTVTGAGYRIRQGPLTASQLISGTGSARSR